MNRILNSFIRVSYGILFPMALLFFTLTSHFQIQKQSKIEAFKSQMSNQLNLLFDYHSDPVFFHALLQKNFHIADRSAKPRQALNEMVVKFKKRFNNNIEFIVWDKMGKLNKRLSDKTNYRYVLGKVFKSIGMLSELCTKNFPPTIARSQFFKKNMGLLRKILGRLLVIGEIHHPFGNLYMGKCTVASTSENNGLVWYQKGNNYTLVSFINKKILSKNLPVEILTKRFNYKSKGVKLAAYDFFTQKMYGVDEVNQTVKRSLNVEVGKYTLAAPPFKETKDLLLLFRQPSENLLIFSYAKKIGEFSAITTMRNKIICRVISILIIIYFVLYAYFLVHQMPWLSVKQKLILLFLFVSFIGLFTIVATAYKFFAYKKNVLINEIQNKSLQGLTDIGKKYTSIRNQMGEQLNQFLDDQIKVCTQNKWSQMEKEKFRAFVVKMNPCEAFTVCSETEKISVIHKKKNVEITKSSVQLLSLVLRLANKVKIDKNMKNLGPTLVNLRIQRLLHNALGKLNRIELARLLTSDRWSFNKLLKSKNSSKSWGLLSVAWSFDEMQNLFFHRHIMQLNKDFMPRKLIVMTKDNEVIFPENMRKDPKIRNALHRAFTRSLIIDNNLVLGDRSYIATAISEDTLLKCSLMALYPREIVEKEILNLKFITLFLTSISSILLLIISWIFSNVLIAPITELAIGVNKIRENDFAYKIKNISNDELGDLESLVNETMESLEILSVGTSIQKSLLPSRNYKMDKIELYADSVFMTKMGGDYFDYFEKNKDHLTLIFGDVAGHGIPAGMVMGMVKAIVVEASTHKTSPLPLLSKINEVLRKLKKRGWRGAMSCQCLDISSQTGKITIANAGHCFPVIVDAKGKDARYLKALGMVLGSRFEKRTNEEIFDLNEGETLILYSDGIVEGLNKFGEPLGYDKLKKFIIRSWSPDPKVYWNNIYSLYNDWAQEQDDDITFMVIRMHKS